MAGEVVRFSSYQLSQGVFLRVAEHHEPPGLLIMGRGSAIGGIQKGGKRLFGHRLVREVADTPPIVNGTQGLVVCEARGLAQGDSSFLAWVSDGPAP